GLIERLAGGEADVAERLLQVLRLDVLVALDLEALDRGTFEHGNDERAAVATQFDVAEKPGRVHRTHRLGNLPVIERVADVDGQVVEDRAFGDALQAFDANVTDREAVGAARGLRERNGCVSAHRAARGDRERRVNDGSEAHSVAGSTSGVA